MLAAASCQLPEQAVRACAARRDPDDLAKVGLGIEISTQGDVRPRPEQQQLDVLRLVLELLGDQGDDAGKVPSFEQLVGCRDHGSIHDLSEEQAPGQPRVKANTRNSAGLYRAWRGCRQGRGVEFPGAYFIVVLRAVIVAIALGATVAYGAPPRRHGIWSEIVDPHGAEVAAILVRVHDDFRQADEPPDLDPGGAQRARFYRDALGMLHYARKLAPENISVLQAIAHAAERLGNTREAVEALETAVRAAGPDDGAPGVVAPLGALYLRLGRIDDAIHILRAARTPLAADAEAATSATVYLANALSARGDLSAAIDVLVNALPSNAVYARGDLPMLSLALAVAYDRDGQPSAAFDVLEHLQSRLSSQLGPTLQHDLAMLELSPIEDQHYYAGLLYEVVGSYVDARAEWVMYAAMNGRYRARALQHVAEIDAHRRAVSEAR